MPHDAIIIMIINNNSVNYRMIYKSNLRTMLYTVLHTHTPTHTHTRYCAVKADYSTFYTTSI